MSVPTASRSRWSAAERLTRQELDAARLRKLSHQVERLRERSTFYERHWRAAALPVDPIRSAEDIRRLPYMNKEDVLADQLETPPYGERLVVSESEVHEITLSSGTSGSSKEVHAHSKADAQLRGEMTAIGWGCAGLQAEDVAIAHVAANNAASLWCMTRGIRALGRMPYLVGHLGFDERLEMMERFGVDLMFAMPSALNGLAARCRERSIDPSDAFPGLRSIMTSGESWPVEWVERMEEFWGARLFEVYGSTQTNSAYGASCCERGAVVEGARAFNHLFEWTAWYEIINPTTLAPAEPGEVGELVVTHLDKEASPLVRFRTGDLVRWFPPGACPCGRATLVLETGTITRLDDQLKLRGQNVSTAAVDALLFAHEEVDEFQVDITIAENGRERLDLRVGLRRQVEIDEPSFAETLVSELRNATQLRFDIHLVPTDDLPHFDSPDRKARRWNDRRHAGLAGESDAGP